MNKKDIVKEGLMFSISLICGVCAIFMGIALHMEHLYEPYLIIRNFETVLFITSGTLLTFISFYKLFKSVINHWKEQEKIEVVE